MTDSSSRNGPVVHFLYEPGDGGLDRVAILLANGMAKRGIATELWLTKATGSVAHMIAPEVTVRMVPTPKFGNRSLQLLLQIPAVARMIRKYQPKVIFSAGNQSNLSAAVACKLSGIRETRFIQKITNPILRPGMGHWLKKYRIWRFGFTARFADLCLTLSAADAKNYAQLYPQTGAKFRFVANPYVNKDMLALGESRKDRRPGGGTRLLAVGRIEPQKGYFTLLSALVLIADRRWTMTVLGGGNLLEKVQLQAENLGLGDRITFQGFISDPVPYYAQSDILVLSSLWEGLPAVPLEAMATGCAVVTTDCSDGLTQLLSQIGQKSVPVRNPEALAKAIATAIDEPQPIDPLRTCAKQFSIENSIDRHIDLMRQTLTTD